MIWLGFLAIAFTVIHDGYHLYHRRPWDLLWACHLASAVIGVGCVFDWPWCVGIGVLWLVVGVPLWIIGLATTMPFLPTSLLTHVGGLAVGLIYVSQNGMSPGSWWRAILILIALQQICRWVTPVEANVNLAFTVEKSWQGWFPTYFRYWLALKAVSILIYVCTEYSLRFLFGEPIAA